MNAATVSGLYRNLPRLVTARLLLRKAALGDVPDICAYSSDADVTRYLRWGPHKTLAQTDAYVREVLEQYQEGLDGPWVMEHRQDHTVIGHIHLMDIDPRHRRAQVGFLLLRSYWNQGLATEALREVLEYSLGGLGLNRVEGLCISENRAAARVMEKAGMKREAELRDYAFQKGALWDFTMYSILRRDSSLDRADNAAAVESPRSGDGS
jgi:ribosomal-protein-alanine N-acetyltransferase